MPKCKQAEQQITIGAWQAGGGQLKCSLFYAMPTPDFIPELNPAQIESLIERLAANNISATDRDLIMRLLRLLRLEIQLLRLLAEKDVSLARLKRRKVVANWRNAGAVLVYPLKFSAITSPTRRKLTKKCHFMGKATQLNH